MLIADIFVSSFFVCNVYDCLAVSVCDIFDVGHDFFFFFFYIIWWMTYGFFV